MTKKGKEGKEWLMKTVQIDKKDINQDTGEFIGYASKFDQPDHVNDIIEKGAFTRTLKNKGTKKTLLWQHNPYEPIGNGEHEEDSSGLLIRGSFNLDTAKGKEAYSLVKRGDINGLSIGFNIEDSYMKDEYRYIKEINLWETSIATFPCLDSARILEVRSYFLGDKVEDKKQLVNVEDAIKYLTEYLERFDEKEILGYKSDLENIMTKTTTLLLKAGVITNPFKEHLVKEADSKALEAILVEARKIKIN